MQANGSSKGPRTPPDGACKAAYTGSISGRRL